MRLHFNKDSITVCCSMLLFVAECCSVLQCVAVCYSVLQCNAVSCGQYFGASFDEETL